MKYIVVFVISLACCYSCLLAPLPSKEKIRPAGYTKVQAAGDLRSRLDKSLAALTSGIGNPEGFSSPTH